MLLELELERVAQQLAGAILIAPVEWAARRRGRHVRRHHLEHLRDAARGRPVGERDPPSGRGDPRELARRRLVIGREHDPAGGRDLVEAPVCERQLLGVADDVLDLEPELCGALLRSLDQDGCEVEARDTGAGGGGALGDRTRAASKVEPAVAGLRRQPLATTSWMSVIVSVIRW